MSVDLPFTIRARHSTSDTAVFIACVGDREITAERYSVGNGDRRRKVADLWRQDERLGNGQMLRAADIARELERVEGEVRKSIDDAAEDDDEGVNVLRTAGYVDDEIIVEMVWNIEVGRADFIVYDRATQTVGRVPYIDNPEVKILPPRNYNGIVTPGGHISGTVFIPTHYDETGQDEGRLREDLETFIRRYVELPGESTSIAVEYVLLTWVHDAFDELPYWSFRTADAGRGKSRALETVGSVCYRGMFCGGGSSAPAMLRIIDIYRGTLVADEFDHAKNTELAAELTRLLNQGFQKNRPLLKCIGEDNAPTPFYAFGPKLFALRGRFADDATETRIFSTWMKARTRPEVPINLPRARFDREALSLRNRLLAWRCANLGRIKIDPSLADPRLEDRANQIGLPLMAIAGTDDARERIVSALLEQQSSIAADRLDTLPGAVLEAVLAIAQPDDSVLPGDVAREVNRRRAEIEGIEIDKLRRPVSPHRVGKVLSGELELPREPRTGGGIPYRLDPSRLEQLAQRFGMASPGASTPNTPSTPDPEPAPSTHPSTPASTPENRRFEPKNGDRVLGVQDVLPLEEAQPAGVLTGVHGGVLAEGDSGPDTDQQPYDDPDPDIHLELLHPAGRVIGEPNSEDDVDIDAEERLAIMAVEAEAARADEELTL